MGKQSDKNKNKKYLIFSIVSNLSILFLFKYANFSSYSINYMFSKLNIFYTIPYFNFLLPLGISFYTFQTMSYSIDVYRGVLKPEKHLGIFALYVTFFPQLVAGPIERAEKLLPQFYKKYEFDYERTASGIRKMVWGFFKKIVIADRLAVFVDKVYIEPSLYQGPSLIIATVFFAIQIYCDFSGYCDIAIGVSKILGFDLMENFNKPYFSKSIQEFWKRWHISLSTWFKDYLYIPLGGNRVVKWKRYYNLFIVFLISGLWHGSNWTFIMWGALHGFYLLFSYWTLNIRVRVRDFFGLDKNSLILKYFQICLTFILVCFSWIFFRAKNIADALYICSNLFSGFSNIKFNLIHKEMIRTVILLQQPRWDFILAVIFVVCLFLVEFLQQKYNIKKRLLNSFLFIRWGLYYVIVLVVFVFGIFSKNQFIYFQF